MNITEFFEKFELFADTPNAVGKMRGLVLELAVRGRLVGQSVADEPASELLKRVHREKVRLKARPEPPDSERGPTSGDDVFTIPGNWQWIGATTPAVMISDQGKKILTKDILASGKYPVVDQGKVFIRGYCNDPDRVIGVTEPIVLFGDHTRETKLIDFDFVVGADGVKLLQPVCIDPKYYFLVLQWLPLESRGYGRHFKLLKAARIPLPPLAEQKRIVAKVDELMALCDRLEAQQQERDTRHAALVRASLTRFAEAPTPANLDFLFHKSYPITPADLRKAILSLAVQGKLVFQDMDDESGQELLGKIEAERTRAIKARRVNAMKPVPAVASDELAYDVPSNWGVARLSQLVMELQTGPFGSSLHKSDYQLGGTPVINPASIRDGRIEAIEEMAIGKDTLKRLAGFKLIAGDIIMARRGEMGRCAVVTDKEESWLCGTGSLVLRMPKSLHGPFLAMLIGAPQAREYLGDASVGTTMQNLNQSILANMPVGVPPLAEQRRIVAKVDQLMALVDQMETQLAASRAAAEELMVAVVAELTAQE